MKQFVTCVAFSALLVAGSSVLAAPQPVPKEALKALMVTKGKPCSAGVVFMDGQYLPPPYVVKRYGTAIMINDVQVTAPLVSWDEFLKTQSGTVEVAAQPADSSAPAAAPQPEPVSSASAADDDPLADLFDDDPKPKAKPKAKKHASPPVAAAPKRTLTGPFVANDASKALVARINRYRTDVNMRLLRGGFVFFGSRYSSVSGASQEAERLMSRLPKLMRTCSTGAELNAGLRQNGFYYLTDQIADDLIRHKYQYPQIEARSRQMSEDAQMNALLNGGK